MTDFWFPSVARITEGYLFSTDKRVPESYSALLCIMTLSQKFEWCLKYEVAFVVGSLYPYITFAFYFKYCSENDEEITKIDVTLFRKLLILLDQQSLRQ